LQRSLFNRPHQCLEHHPRHLQCKATSSLLVCHLLKSCQSAVDKELLDKLLQIVEEFRPTVPNTAIAHDLQERHFAGQDEGTSWIGDVGRSMLGVSPEINWKISFRYSGDLEQLVKDRSAIDRFLGAVKELCGEGATISKLSEG
jgi:hypothetical protein